MTSLLHIKLQQHSQQITRNILMKRSRVCFHNLVIIYQDTADF